MEVTSEIGTDSKIESMLTALWGVVEGGGMGWKGKGAYEHGQQCVDCAQGGGLVEVEEGIRRINDSGKIQ